MLLLLEVVPSQVNKAKTLSGKLSMSTWLDENKMLAAASQIVSCILYIHIVFFLGGGDGQNRELWLFVSKMVSNQMVADEIELLSNFSFCNKNSSYFIKILIYKEE